MAPYYYTSATFHGGWKGIAKAIRTGAYFTRNDGNITYEALFRTADVTVSSGSTVLLLTVH
jgi:hypothetical protein